MAEVKPLTKSALFAEIATATNLSKKDVSAVFDSLVELIKKQFGKKGPGEVTIPGLIKMVLKKIPARKAKMGPNPFKPGEMMEFKARPAKNVVKSRVLKKLNDQVN